MNFKDIVKILIIIEDKYLIRFCCYFNIHSYLVIDVLNNLILIVGVQLKKLINNILLNN